MAGVAFKHLQTAYMGLHNSLQHEWAFLKYVTLDIGTAFQPLEDTLHDAFLPALFKGATSQIPRRAVTGLLVKQ